MAFNHFSPAFAKETKALVEGWKKSGFSALDAARELERHCGKQNEEFAEDGLQFVADIYGGVFEGGQAGRFRELTEAEKEAKQSK